MKNIFIAAAIIATLSACAPARTNLAIDPMNTESRFCNLNCPFHGIGNGTHGVSGHAGASVGATGGANHGASAARGGMGHSGNGGSGAGSSGGTNH